MKKLLYVALLAVGVIILMTPPAIAQEEKPFTLHGELRFRGEYDANAQDFDKDNTAGADDQFNYWPYRVRIAAEGKFTKNVTAWIEFQNGGVFGSLGQTAHIGSDPLFTGNSAELYQGNITLDKLWWKNFTARIGRQEIVEGTELMLGDLDFYQGQTFDGFTGNFKLKKGNIMLFYTRVNESKGGFFSGAGFLPPDQIASSGGGDINFAGAYTDWNIPIGTLDLYLLNLTNHAALQDITTLGVRWARDMVNKNGLFWNAEYGQETGDANAADKAKGNVAEGWIGWNMKSGKNNHRFYARIGMASGDDDPTDTDQKQFVPMFGDFHNRLGHGDFFQLSGNSTGLGGAVGALSGNLGIQGTGVGWNGMFGDRHEVGAEYWSFKTDKKDPVTNFDKLGTELDVWYGYNFSKNLTFMAAVAELSPDDALTGGGGANNDKVDRIYGNARLRF